MSVLPFLLLIGLVIVIWHNELRYRELANSLAVKLCTEQNVQLLDQTVARSGTRLVWRALTPAIERTYRFEYSREGEERLSGFFCLCGEHCLWADFEETRLWFH